MKNKVIDAFSFFNEFDILKLRLNYLSDVVDYFLICECNYTYSAIPKPYYLDQIIENIPENIRTKIIRIKYEVDGGEYNNQHWRLENEQRDFISKNLSQFSSDDIIMISDLDEIPNKNCIQKIINSWDKEACYALKFDLFRYNFNTFLPNYWWGTAITSVKKCIENGSQWIRNEGSVVFNMGMNGEIFEVIDNSGWHFSYFFNAKKIQYKIKSFAHHEFDKQKYNSLLHIDDCIKNKKDLYDSKVYYSNHNFYNFPEDLKKNIIDIFPENYYKNTAMKVLYVYNFAYLDYQSDTVYHGLIDSGVDVYETHYPSYMLNGYMFDKQSMYGDVWQDIYGGMPGTTFTLYGKLDYNPKVESKEIILDKIRSKFYDIVIYGCVYDHDGMPRRKCLDYLDEVIKYYSKHEIHFIDGSDNLWNYAHSDGIAPYGTVWKSQLENIGAANPICFGIPESQLIKTNPKKEKIFADIIPGNRKTYVYSDEKSYYNDYAISYYGRTWKKGQWNCLRHLEILANKCIPYFPDIENCPPFVMVDFPKEIFKETNKYAQRYEIHPNYEWINDYLFEYTKNNLTTKKIVERFLK